MRSPTMLDASDNKSASGAPVRCDTLSASVTSERPGASMRTSRSSSASVAEMPQSIAAATRKNSVCTGSCAWAPTNRMPWARECPEASDMESAVKASGMASSTSCCSRRWSKVSRAAPTPSGATSPRTKPMGDNDTMVRAMQQTPLDSNRNARRAASSSITKPRRCTGTNDAHERAIFVSRSFSTSSRGSFSAIDSSVWRASCAGGTRGA